jgi:hypothetical protein
MKRRSIIDLTPMLDVILLLVFGFMFVLASTNSLLFKTEEELDMALSENSSQVESLNEDIDDLNDEVFILNKKIIALEEYNAKIKSGLEKHFKINKIQLEQALNQSDDGSVAMLLDNYSKESDIAYSMVMYELLASEFYFVEVIIKGDTQQIWINDKPTPVVISFEDAQSLDAKNEKINEIKNEVSKVIDSRPGGSSMAFVTLFSDNDEVYHFAWDLTWDAIKNLEEKYGAKNYYSAEVFIKREVK